MGQITELRNRLSRSLLEKVAGPDGTEQTARIHATPGPRWFAKGSPVRVVHGDASMYIGGMRALLLQALHPLAMAAVEEHSDYRENTWGRLARTATYISETTYGTIEHAERAIRIVRAVHKRVHGTAPDGRPYRADDPHLITWVHVAEIESFLVAHEHFGREKLTPAQYDEYVRQAGEVAIRLGAESVPNTRAELSAAIEAFRPELQGTPAAADVAEFLLRHAPLPRPIKPAYWLLGRAAVATLPRWAREPLRVPDHPRRDRTTAVLGGRLGTAGLRWLTSAEPMRHPVPPSDAASHTARPDPHTLEPR
ncbi:oxygenase MpaB family protein [Occultella glacieicola]|uniref:oxygenase MpaB family protein n=1 Tax=Occultella glacieicola TaxID=2518684 RepID=UPI001F16F20E|nr:oxygenase MpaB family protein [Occultella glacieicola]